MQKKTVYEILLLVLCCFVLMICKFLVLRILLCYAFASSSSILFRYCVINIDDPAILNDETNSLFTGFVNIKHNVQYMPPYKSKFWLSHFICTVSLNSIDWFVSRRFISSKYYFVESVCPSTKGSYPIRTVLNSVEKRNLSLKYEQPEQYCTPWDGPITTYYLVICISFV